ncbi:probable E3 ubiquitin-protein ligase XERICO [Phaseolus vulgaris]
MVKSQRLHCTLNSILEKLCSVLCVVFSSIKQEGLHQLQHESLILRFSLCNKRPTQSFLSSDEVNLAILVLVWGFKSKYKQPSSIKMGLSSLPEPSEGMLCVLLVNTSLSISLFKGIVRTILHIVGIRVASSSPSQDISQSLSEQSEGLIEEFRSRIPSLRFGTMCGGKQPQDECCVCLTRFKPESEINRLPCGHLFHKVCLEKWLDYWNTTCPLCRTPLMPEDDTSWF